jgi:hypothetical protein
VVRCANPADADFPPLVRECDGLIELTAHADEGGGDHRCPSCERIVFPDSDDKQRFDTLAVRLKQAGVEAYLITCCGDLAAGRAFVNGVLTLPVQGLNAALCLVEHCSDERWLGRGPALAQPCVYVTVEPEAAPRTIRDDAIAHVELTVALVRLVDLRAVIVERATRPPAVLSNLDVPVYGLGARPISPRTEMPQQVRRFLLSCSGDGVFVDGLLIVRASRTTACLVMQALIARFVAALAVGGSVAPMTTDDLADAVQQRISGVQDAQTIRRIIVRIRSDIADAVRRTTGQPIGDNDVIETVSRTGAADGAQGYRLNPATVTLGAPTA